MAPKRLCDWYGLYLLIYKSQENSTLDTDSALIIIQCSMLSREPTVERHHLSSITPGLSSIFLQQSRYADLTFTQCRCSPAGITTHHNFKRWTWMIMVHSALWQSLSLSVTLMGSFFNVCVKSFFQLRDSQQSVSTPLSIFHAFWWYLLWD